jgi:hypothetical protein
MSQRASTATRRLDLAAEPVVTFPALEHPDLQAVIRLTLRQAHGHELQLP